MLPVLGRTCFHRLQTSDHGRTTPEVKHSSNCGRCRFGQPLVSFEKSRRAVLNEADCDPARVRDGKSISLNSQLDPFPRERGVKMGSHLTFNIYASADVIC